MWHSEIIYGGLKWEISKLSKKKLALKIFFSNKLLYSGTSSIFQRDFELKKQNGN